MWVSISVAISQNKAGGRCLLHEHTRVSGGKAVAFSMMLQKKFLWFLYFKKSKLPLDVWGQLFNLAVTLIRDIQFKIM